MRRSPVSEKIQKLEASPLASPRSNRYATGSSAIRVPRAVTCAMRVLRRQYLACRGQRLQERIGILQVIEDSEAQRQAESAVRQLQPGIQIAIEEFDRGVERTGQSLEAQRPVEIRTPVIDGQDAASAGFEKERQVAIAAADVEHEAGIGQRRAVSSALPQKPVQDRENREGIVRVPVEVRRAIGPLQSLQPRLRNSLAARARS